MHLKSVSERQKPFSQGVCSSHIVVFAWYVAVGGKTCKCRRWKDQVKAKTFVAHTVRPPVWVDTNLTLQQSMAMQPPYVQKYYVYFANS